MAKTPPSAGPVRDPAGRSPAAGAAAGRGWLADPAELFHQALPWVISLLAHFVLFMLLALIVWAVQATTQVTSLPVPEARIEHVLGERLSAAPAAPDLAVTQDEVPVQAQDLAEQSVDLLSEFAGSGSEDLSIIGIGAGASGGDLATYGLKSGSLGEGPSFFGLGRDAAQARKICYIVDRSGSMVDQLDYVKDEVIRSVSRLQRTQQYHIIFFSKGMPIEGPPRDFVYAINEYKQRSFAFLRGIEAAGSTDPIPAMARAFKLGADLIYFLTDGEFSEELIFRLQRWNVDKDVRIYTIAFIGNKGEPLLRQIAEENGGDFTFVSWDDLH